MERDIRCAHTLDVAQADHGIRCQLLAGHDGKHVAVGVTTNAAREIYRWTEDLTLNRNPFQADRAAALPWAPGMPATEIAAPR